MKIVFEKIFERDIDFLVINKFVNDPNFKGLFLNKINFDKNYELVSAEHSLMDENGESDITIILKNDAQKIGLLIEDKIDAIAMPNQRGRYDLRGAKGIKNGDYADFFVFIIAPEEYLKTNVEAKKYENRISYEELLDYFKKDSYASQLLSQAIMEKENGYTVIEDKNVTEFWQRYYQNIRENYPTLKINEVTGPRGASAVWPEIKTPLNRVHIIHKSDRGFLDLTFPKMGAYMNIFQKYIGEYLSEGMTIERTNKSAAVRITVPKIDFKMSFDDYLPEIKVAMDEAVRLCDLAMKINLKGMYEEIDNNLKY